MRILLFLSLLTFPLHGNLVLTYPFPAEGIEKEEEVRLLQEEIEAISFGRSSKSMKKLIQKKAPTLEKRLLKKVFGQDQAVKETAAAIVRFAAGVNDPDTVVASLLFSGPSGVGKTELAKQLCSELYGNFDHFVRINMSEFSESHTISRLIGSPPGYINSSEGGQLSNALIRNPYSVVLLDEIEKAHPQVLKLFLHIFDEGVFTSSMGRKVDCRKSIFICTSNILASEIAELHQEGYDTHEIGEYLRPYFIARLSPELFNRLNFVVFTPLTNTVIKKLVDRLLGELNDRVIKAREITLIFDETLIEFLIDKGIDPELGARPLKRLIDRELTTVLAHAILDGNFQKGDILRCSYKEGMVEIEFMLRFDED